MRHSTKSNLSSSNTSSMVNNDAILKAIDELNSQAVPNATSTAKQYNVHRSTLQHRYDDQTTSYDETHSMSRPGMRRRKHEGWTSRRMG